MTPYQPVKGDTVRVVLEGPVPSTFTDGRFFLAGVVIDPDDVCLVSVEKVEPAWQEGDLVQHDGLFYFRAQHDSWTPSLQGLLFHEDAWIDQQPGLIVHRRGGKPVSP